MPQKYLHYFGNESSESLLEAYGMVTKDVQLQDQLKPKLCPNCTEPNKPDSKFCAKCRMVLSYDSYTETIEEKRQKESEIKTLAAKYDKDMLEMREQIAKGARTDANSETRTLSKMLDMFKNYTILNPHIATSTTLNGKQYSFPAVQKFKSHWNSIYHYSYKEFENLVIGLRNDSVTLYDFVKHIRLREASKLSKDEWNTPIIEIQHDKLLIRKLYHNLKKLANPREKLELPYDMSIKFRKKAIIERLNQWGIEVKNIKYKLYHAKNFPSGDGEVEFPYLFEVAEINTANHKHEIISGI